VDILRPFQWLTEYGQQKNTASGSIGGVLWGFDVLLSKLEDAREKYRKEKRTGHFGTCIEHCWKVLDKYYMLTDRTRAYVVAIVRDPRQQYHYSERTWRKDQLPNMQMKMESMFQEFH